MIEQAVDRYWKATENSEIPGRPIFQNRCGGGLCLILAVTRLQLWQECAWAGAVFGVPIVLDGYISVAGALCASLINSDCTSYLLASHISAEPLHGKYLEICILTGDPGRNVSWRGNRCSGSDVFV